MKIKIKRGMEEVNDVLETAENVKGEKFADFVKFMISAKQSFEITMMYQHIIKQSELTDLNSLKLLENILTLNFTQMTAYCNSIGNFTEQESEEAIKLCDVILKKVKKDET